LVSGQSLANTYDNDYTLNHTFHYDPHKHFFSACITITCLDTFWPHQAVKFDYTADLTGTVKGIK